MGFSVHIAFAFIIIGSENELYNRKGLGLDALIVSGRLHKWNAFYSA